MSIGSNGLDTILWTGKKLLQQSDANANQDSRDPATVVHVFLKKNLSHDRAGDKRHRGRSRSNQAQFSPGECRQQAEEANGKAAQRQEKALFAEYSADYGQRPAAGAQLVEITNALHGAGEQDVSAARGEHDHEDGGPQLKRFHVAPRARANGLHAVRAW